MLNDQQLSPAAIRAIRERLGLTQADFGKLLNAHFVTVSRWESGQLQPDAYQLSMLHEFDRAARTKEIKDSLKAVLIGAGIGAALYLILRAARGGQ